MSQPNTYLLVPMAGIERIGRHLAGLGIDLADRGTILDCMGSVEAYELPRETLFRTARIIQGESGLLARYYKRLPDGRILAISDGEFKKYFRRLPEYERRRERRRALKAYVRLLAKMGVRG